MNTLLRIATFALLTLPIACSVSSEGLHSSYDGATGGTSGTVICPAGLTDQASWPANSEAGACGRVCGPDGIGLQICRQSELNDCRKRGGCVCLQAPCVMCEDCTFPFVPDCYIPTNAATASLCSADVGKGEACAPACGKKLCLGRDGKTGCVCNLQGKHACGDWGTSGWK